MAIWQSLRPPAAASKKQPTETPIPAHHRSTVLPLWDDVASLLDTAKKDADQVARTMNRLQPTGLATAGANSAQNRVVKLARFGKVRDLKGAMGAVGAALTKVNLCWAGVETMKGDTQVQDLVPIVKGIVDTLTDIKDKLENIDSILNPKMAEEDSGRGRGKRVWKKAKNASRAASIRVVTQKVPQDQGESYLSAETQPESESLADTQVEEPIEGGPERPPNVRTRAGTVVGAAKVAKIVRRLRDAKITTQGGEQGEFGEDPIAALKRERERAIGEAEQDLGEFFKLRAERRSRVGGFRPGTIGGTEAIVGMMLNKPKTAGASLGATRPGKWGKLHAGIRGDVDPASLPISGVAEERPKTPKTPETPSSRIGRAASGIKSALSLTRRAKTPPKTPPRTGKDGGLTRSKSGRSISFDVDESIEQPTRVATPGESGRVSTAPVGRGRSGGDDAFGGAMPLTAPDAGVRKELSEVRRGFGEMLKKEGGGKIDMDAFKEAFHESSDKAQLKEEEEKKEKETKKKKKRKTGIIGGFMSGLGKRATAIVGAAARAVTPDSPFGGSRGKKKYKVTGKRPEDESVLKESLEYWMKAAGEGDDPQAKAWANYNVGLIEFCKGEDEKALARLSDAKKSGVGDLAREDLDFRIGQIKSRSKSAHDRTAGLELLRSAVDSAISDEALGDKESFFIAASGSFGSAAYENSELKNATRCMDHLLREGRWWGTDEALVTKAQILLRRGEYEEAQKFYSNLGQGNGVVEGLVKDLVSDGVIGKGWTDRKGAARGNFRRRPYIYPDDPNDTEFGKIGCDLAFTRAPRRKETLRAAGEAYMADPRHLSR